ncbi:MAG: hypothetical protein GVY24_02235 [Planctomycetes bacterium]|jgi:hypothetical protein|nr:hypothetical protein [Planctomycetota bacterium]
MSMSADFRILGLLVIVILLALIAAGITLIILGLVGRKPRLSDGGVCGKCGYSVKGLSALNCPECGSDLREVGIERPGGVAGKNVALIGGIVLLGLVLMCVITTFLFYDAQVRTVPSQPIVTSPVRPMPPAQP